MSRAGDTRFRPGQSGNPAGRPKARRPHVSAFDVVFDKTLTVTQGGVERELTIEEGLQLQTLQAALSGSKIAIRQVLKMIEKREAALARRNPPPVPMMKVEHEYDSPNAYKAMRILGIADFDPAWADVEESKRRMKVSTWAAQAGLSRPGRRKLEKKDVDDINFFTFDPDKLRWPKGRLA